jgi:hypothetical protein
LTHARRVSPSALSPQPERKTPNELEEQNATETKKQRKQFSGVWLEEADRMERLFYFLNRKMTPFYV